MKQYKVIITSSIGQGIIDSTGTETFAKEPKLAKLLRELKLTPYLRNNKVHWFFSRMFVTFIIYSTLYHNIVQL